MAPAKRKSAPPKKSVAKANAKKRASSAKKGKLPKKVETPQLDNEEDWIVPITENTNGVTATNGHGRSSNGTAKQNGKASKAKRNTKAPVEVVKEKNETDDEGDWTPPNYKDKAWMLKEAYRCQTCDKTYEKHGDALACITVEHKALRCYLCFRVYPKTEDLFRHFEKRHGKATDKERTLTCPYCHCEGKKVVEVPWKSVSCHVISYHLTTRATVPVERQVNSPIPTNSKGTSKRGSTKQVKPSPKTKTGRVTKAKTVEAKASSSGSVKKASVPPRTGRVTRGSSGKK